MSAANENTPRLTQFKNKGKDATVSNKCAATIRSAVFFQMCHNYVSYKYEYLYVGAETSKDRSQC